MEKAFSLKGTATAKVHKVAWYVETQKMFKNALWEGSLVKHVHCGFSGFWCLIFLKGIGFISRPVFYRGEKLAFVGKE